MNSVPWVSLLKLICLTVHKESREDKSDMLCLQALRLTNPNDDMACIEDTKGGLLEDLCRWILNNQDFINWKNGDNTRLLWIKGDPGKGKTMLPTLLTIKIGFYLFSYEIPI